MSVTNGDRPNPYQKPVWPRTWAGVIYLVSATTVGLVVIVSLILWIT